MSKINVDVADSGKVCMEMVAKQHYDLIFLDHMMPEMDGIQTLHHMKDMSDNKCENSPIVALTANAITGAKEMYLAEGFDAFLPKPINPEKLEQMILKLLPRDLLKFDVEEEKGEVAKSENRQVCTQEISLPMIDGIDWSYGLLHLPTEEMLVSTVQDFYKTLEVEADTLDGFYQQIKSNADMLTQYRIKVHAMKSSANLIGATVLGGMAKLLENAARDADILIVDALHDIFLQEWRSYKEKMKDCISETVGDKQVEQEKEEVEDYEVISTYLESMRMAAMEFDIDKMDEIMKQLECYQYPDSMQVSIEKLSIYVTNMDAEQVVVVIEEITNQIKSVCSAADA